MLSDQQVEDCAKAAIAWFEAYCAVRGDYFWTDTREADGIDGKGHVIGLDGCFPVAPLVEAILRAAALGTTPDG